MIYFKEALKNDPELRSEFYEFMQKTEEKEMKLIQAAYDKINIDIMRDLRAFAESKGFTLKTDDNEQMEALIEACQKVSDEIAKTVADAFAKGISALEG